MSDMRRNAINTLNMMDEALVKGVMGTLEYCQNEIKKEDAINIFRLLNCVNYQQTE